MGLSRDQLDIVFMLYSRVSRTLFSSTTIALRFAMENSLIPGKFQPSALSFVKANLSPIAEQPAFPLPLISCLVNTRGYCPINPNSATTDLRETKPQQSKLDVPRDLRVPTFVAALHSAGSSESDTLPLPMRSKGRPVPQISFWL